MNRVVAGPNLDVALALLVAGHDEKGLLRLARFANLKDARAFASQPDVRAEVERAAEAQARRLGRKGLNALERLLDSDATDGRTRVAAARAAMEAGGILRRDARPSELKQLRELTVAELNEMIEQTRVELEQAQARAQPVARISSS